MQTWLIVDEDTKTILGGPYEWDGNTEWEPPVAGAVILESEAYEQGYTWPPTPDAGDAGDSAQQ